MATKTPIQFESFSDPDCTESSGEKWESDESPEGLEMEQSNQYNNTEPIGGFPKTTFSAQKPDKLTLTLNIKEKDGGVEFNIKSWLRNEAINAVGLEIRTMKKKAYEYSKKELMNMIEAEENKIIKKGGMKAVRIAALSAIGLPFLGFL